MRRSSRAFMPWLALGAVLLALGLPFAVAGVATIPAAQAAGGCLNGCIHWDSSMIYPGQNNGFPEGPVGEHALVHGEGFVAAAGQTLTFQVVRGDVTASDTQFCQLANPKVPLSGTATPDSSGKFDFDFVWPAAASSGQWSICAYRASDGTPLFNTDDGPFSVLAAQPPSLALSNASVHPGDTITLTGHNWLPAQGQIFVYIGPCADCGGAPLASTMATSAGDGSFSVTLNIPASAAAGGYIASAHNASSVLDLIDMGPHVVVNLAPTATPKPTATATSAPTATAAPNTTSSGSSNGSGGGNNALLVVIGILVVVLLLVIAGLVIFLLSRNRQNPPGPGGPPAPPGAYGSYSATTRPGSPVTPGGYPPSAYPDDAATLPGRQQPWSPEDNDAPTVQSPADPFNR